MSNNRDVLPKESHAKGAWAGTLGYPNSSLLLLLRCDNLPNVLEKGFICPKSFIGGYTEKSKEREQGAWDNYDSAMLFDPFERDREDRQEGKW